MKINALLLSAALAFPPVLALPAAAQAPGVAPAIATPAASAALTGLKFPWNRVKDILVRAAEKMPEENYAFKASPDVKSFGQLVGHVADANYMFVAMASGEKPVPRDVEKTKTSKADLVAALKDSFAVADKALSMTDADLATPMTMFGMETNRFAVVGLMIAHDWEHYGNMVTYMRIKGIVPPSSEPRPEAAKPANK
jgi:uncharacterized damage-inducible protein DinB